MDNDVSCVFDLLEWQNNNFPKTDAITGKENNEWRKYSTKEYIKLSRYVSCALLSKNIGKNDKVMTITNNRPEWNFTDMGILQIGAIHVPVYPTISSDEYRYIIEHSDAKIVFISDKNLYQKIKPIINQINKGIEIITYNNLDNSNKWIDFVELGKKSEAKYANQLDKLKKEVKPDDVASIIYTSGTTGLSKGVMLTHHNFVSNFKAPVKALPLNVNHCILSFLPLCHVYERLLNYLFQYKGVSIYYAQNIGTIINDLKEIKAQGFDTVPRLLEKVFDTIMQKAKDLRGIKRKLFDWALDLGLKYELDGANGKWYELQLSIANKLVFSKWREALGGNIRFIGCGGAALQERLARVFWAAKIPIQEGYGLTETSPLIAFNWYKTPGLRLGTVGPVIPGIEVKIADDGEILVRGSNVMKGYYKNKELTKSVIDIDGWFHTGDVGKLVDNKYLKITDRKKDIFKMSSGKYISPQVIENKLKEINLIEQAMVIGENQKFASAIICPNFQLIKDLANKKQIAAKSDCELVQHPEIKTQFQKEIEKLNKKLGEIEHIKRFQLICDQWSPDTGELSPTLKLKRKEITAKYQQVIDKIYSIEKK